MALVPSNGGSIRLTNPQAIQKALQAATSSYQTITEVRQFGRGGIVCRSPDQSCVADLLRCSSFASLPVSAYIPAHLACTKGIVRGVDADLSPAETLERLSGTGVIAVYRCNRMVDNKRVPTESVIATFAGTSCPSELKVWPLVFRVEPLASRPLQCRNCWRYGHSMAGCKSKQRCCACGDEHAQSDCSAQEERCCLCDGNHPADYSNCSVRAQELQVIEIIDRRRCSRMEAINIVKERASGYAGIIGRQNLTADLSLTATIEAAVEKAVTKAMERLAMSLGECISQAISSHLSHLMQTTCPTPVTTQTVDPEHQASHKSSDTIPSNDDIEPSTSSSKGPTTGNLINTDLEMTEVELNSRAYKRTMSSINEDSSPGPHSKAKKSQSSAVLKQSILQKAVSAAALSKT